MAKVLIITNPSHDRATEYLEAWSEKLITSKISGPDIKYFELKKEEATKSNLTKLIQEENPTLVLLHGHGDNDCICGHDFEVLVKVNENENIFKDKIVHALACSSGDVLGPKSIDIGGTAYLGYDQNYKLTHTNQATKNDQQSDVVAGLFLEPAFEVVKRLLEGKTVQESYGESQKMALKNIMEIMGQPNPNTVVAGRLFHNLQHQVCLGNQSAKFI